MQWPTWGEKKCIFACVHLIGTVFYLHGHPTVPCSSQRTVLTNQPHCLSSYMWPDSPTRQLRGGLAQQKCCDPPVCAGLSQLEGKQHISLWQLRAVAGSHADMHRWVSMVCKCLKWWRKKEKYIFAHLIEIKPPITQLLIFNERCLRWRAEKYEAATEVYKVTGETFALHFMNQISFYSNFPNILGDIHRKQRLPGLLSWQQEAVSELQGRSDGTLSEPASSHQLQHLGHSIDRQIHSHRHHTHQFTR